MIFITECCHLMCRLSYVHLYRNCQLNAVLLITGNDGHIWASVRACDDNCRVVRRGDLHDGRQCHARQVSCSFPLTVFMLSVIPLRPFINQSKGENRTENNSCVEQPKIRYFDVSA